MSQQQIDEDKPGYQAVALTVLAQSMPLLCELANKPNIKVKYNDELVYMTGWRYSSPGITDRYKQEEYTHKFENLEKIKMLMDRDNSGDNANHMALMKDNKTVKR